MITYIEEELSSKRIRSRHVLFFSYKEFSQVGNEDLVVFSSKTKLRTNDLDSKLLSVNYITLKETSPYGINFFNADNSILQASNTKLEEENTEQEELLQDATATIDVQKDSIVKNKKALGKKTKLIEFQTTQIDFKTTEISEKKGVIEFQKTIITVGVLSFLVISILLVLLYSINKKRKLSLIELEDKNKDITDSLNYAKNIQDAILPDAEFFSSSFKDHFVFFEPKEIVYYYYV